MTYKNRFGNHEIWTFDKSGTPQMVLIEWQGYKRGGGDKNDKNNHEGAVRKGGKN